MRSFKFLSIKKPIFRFEITSEIRWTPANFMNHESWSQDKSELIKRWLSDICFQEINDRWSNTKYFPEFDRTCRIIQLGLDTYSYERVFTAIVQIQKSEHEYMEVKLIYPIDNPIYINE